jgi:hypothetical protein
MVKYEGKKPLMVKDAGLLVKLIQAGKMDDIYKIVPDNFNSDKKVFFLKYNDESRDIIAEYIYGVSTVWFGKFAEQFYDSDEEITAFVDKIKDREGE